MSPGVVTVLVSFAERAQPQCTNQALASKLGELPLEDLATVWSPVVQWSCFLFRSLKAWSMCEARIWLVAGVHGIV